MFIYLFIFNHLLHGDTITFKCKSTKSTPAIVGLQKKKINKICIFNKIIFLDINKVLPEYQHFDIRLSIDIFLFVLVTIFAQSSIQVE